MSLEGLCQLSPNLWFCPSEDFSLLKFFANPGLCFIPATVSPICLESPLRGSFFYERANSHVLNSIPEFIFQTSSLIASMEIRIGLILGYGTDRFLELFRYSYSAVSQIYPSRFRYSLACYLSRILEREGVSQKI